MAVEKQKSRSTFFQLFDWNGKSRKKLFSYKFDLPDGSKLAEKSEEKFPETKLHLIKEDETGLTVSIIKGSSDYSFVSSSADDEGNGVRASNVVARLMGLDSLPASSIPDTCSTLESLPQNTRLRSQPNKDEVSFSRKPIESKPQKLHNRPVERFQIETLPPKSAKSVPITHHKLLSPIKSPAGFITAKDAAHLMEAAAKILEPRLLNGTKGKIPKAQSSLIPAKLQDLKQNMVTSQRPISILPVASRRPVESIAVNCVKGHSSNKSWNNSEDAEVGSKYKGKSISLAIQAKVNVQKREGLNLSSRNLLVCKEHNESKSNQLMNSQTDVQKNKKKKSSTANVSSVLQQNNLKQNCPMNKDRLPSNPSVSFGRSKTLPKVSRNTKNGYKKEGLETSNLEKEITSSRKKNFTRKNRSTDRNCHNGKNGRIGSDLVDRNVKLVQPNVVIDERLDQSEDYGRKGMDVISFTFTSPMKKTVPGSLPSGQMEEKRDTMNLDCVDSNSEKNVTNVKNKTLSSLGLNVIGGDALSILLEQKLRELTSGVEPSFSSLVRSGTDNYSQNLKDMSCKKSLSGSYKDTMGSVHDFGCSSTNSQLLNMNREFQEGEGIVKSTSRNSVAPKELEYPQPSPISVLEASLSNETCNSPESYDSTDGSKLYSSFQPQKLLDSNHSNGIPSMEADTEISDSASSSAMETVTSSQTRAESWNLEYVREIISNAELGYLSEVIIEPLVFDELENKKTGLRTEDGEDSKTWRKVLFDCVSESLDLKYSRYFRCGYRTWANGVAVVSRDGFAEEVYKEIMGWRSMGDWMVDKLVDKDMSSQLGSRVNFQREGFEFGVEIEREILCSLVDEVVADILATHQAKSRPA